MANNNANAYQLPLSRGTFADGKLHPSIGGNPYSDDFRMDVIQRFLLNQSLNTAELNALRTIYAYPSHVSNVYCRGFGLVDCTTIDADVVGEEGVIVIKAGSWQLKNNW